METLVFLHGGIGPKNYQRLIDPLRKDYKIIAPDLFALTKTRAFSWEKFAENLNKRIGKKKVYLLGTSLGGGLALAYAVFYPQKVKAIVACEPVGMKVEKGLISLPTWAYRLLKMMIRAFFYPRCIKEALKLFFAILKECTLNLEKLYILVNLAYRQDLEKSLPKIQAPVYLLWSENSGVLPLEMGERLDQRIKTSTFNPNFSDKNHLWCLLEQEKVAKEIKKILSHVHQGERGERKLLISNY